MSTSTTIVYLFGTRDCPACRLFKPTFQRWAERHGGKADFVNVNLDDIGDAARFRVTAVPTVIVLRDDKEIARFVGAPKEEDLARVLDAQPSAGGAAP